MNRKYKEDLLDAFLKIKKPALMDAFLRDILTPVEYRDIITRWQIVKELSNNLPQREIARKLKVSISKITRGSRELSDKHGGFWKILKLTK